MEYNYFVLLFKSLSDNTRLKIIEMLSGEELCACDILKSFNITQPTLSYHMKILIDCGIVNGIRDGAWVRYTLNQDVIKKISEYWNFILTGKDNCICYSYFNSQGEKCKLEMGKKL
jgi:ArsR family transcriptional regulator